MARRERHRFDGKGLRDRASTLVQLREEMGYMAESGPRRPGAPLPLLERNCPILALARDYGEACDVERGLSENLLGARVWRLSTGWSPATRSAASSFVAVHAVEQPLAG